MAREKHQKVKERSKKMIKLEINISRPLKIPSRFQVHKIIWGGSGKFLTEPKKGGRYAFLCVKIPKIVFISLLLRAINLKRKEEKNGTSRG